MKWIKFSEFLPPEGMYIFVISGIDIGIIRWSPQLEEGDEMVMVYESFYQKYTDASSLYAWLPLGVPFNYFRDNFEDDSVSAYKDTEDFKELKRLIKELDGFSKEESESWVEWWDEEGQDNASGMKRMFYRYQICLLLKKLT